MILGITLLILLFIIVIIINPKFDTTMQDVAEKYNVEWRGNMEEINYCGGFRDLSIQNEVSAYICNKGIMFMNADYEKVRLIEWNNVEDVYIENERQIQEEIKLSNIILFGVLALGMDKKKRLINDEYIVLSLRKNEEEKYNVILQTESIQEVFDQILKTRTEFINKSY